MRLMNRFYVFLFLICSFTLIGQTDIPLPNYMTMEELKYSSDVPPVITRGITDPPEFPVRHMAEWEEIQSLVITWAGGNSLYPILKNIARYAKEECEVIVLTGNPNSTQNYLNGNSGGGPLANLDNITFINTSYNSIWVRDYGGNTCYKNDVEEPILVDWIYNRNRPLDDVTPADVADYKGIDLYETTTPPFDLVATGGNFMSDGMGTGFSSELIIDENDGTGDYGITYPVHTTEEIESILQQFMGIDEYITMTVLPYDGIHHIDMHMKLIDEETLLVGQYPDGVADGPQIEANIEYVLSNFTTPWGTPYEIEWIIQPPDWGGQYPTGPFQGGDYRTYTNLVFVNKTVLVPSYEAQYDDQAEERLEELLPGYNIQFIDCNNIIGLSGAIHCITKAVGVDEPLWIAHNPIEDSYIEFEPQQADAKIKHKAGISHADLYWKTDLQGDYAVEPMALTNADEDIWSAEIPGQEFGTTVYYYIEALANDGKIMKRPIVAPEGFYSFEFIGAVGIADFQEEILLDIYPNPANAITVIPLNIPRECRVHAYVIDMLGRMTDEIYHGTVSQGSRKFFIDASTYAPGAYQVVLDIEGFQFNKKLVVR